VRLVTADWVLPVSGPPIRDGAVLVDGERIARVGSAAELDGEAASAERADFPGCVLIPGLVNAHTHLALTAFGGLLEPGEFSAWLGRLAGAVRELDPEDIEASARLGAAHSLSCGVTTVGDIAYGSVSMSAAAGLGLGGVFFWEVLGITRSELGEYLEDRGFPPTGSSPPGTNPGISPHAVYSSGPQVIQACRRLADERAIPFCMHVAESQAEDDLVHRDEGPLSRLAGRLADGFTTPHSSTVAYLDRLGVLDQAIAVHGVRLGADDITTLAKRRAGVVLCPRSNEFLQVGVAPMDPLEEAGVSLALGTDSSASNEDLDLLEEGRALMRLHPRLTPAAVLALVTSGGADVLGFGEDRGRLREGTRADLAAVRTGRVERPEEALIETADAGDVEAVMTGGEWRISGGRASFDVEAIERATSHVREKARFALDQAGGGGKWPTGREPD
jgi:cytosine/adenosine deaminase-related metal-dependent hydrolase